MGQSLSWYLEDSASLLRDQNFQFTAKSQQIRWINSGRRQAAKITGCIRQLIAGQSPSGVSTVAGNWVVGGGVAGQPVTQLFQTIPNVEYYTFDYANRFLQATTQGIKSVIDVLDLAVSWGATRPMMTWYPWDDLQALARSYNSGVTSYPLAWAQQGDGERGQIFLFPVASQICEMEWDCICTPVDLVDNDTYDALPDAFHDSVKFYAAAMGFNGSGRYADAGVMMQSFMGSLGVARPASGRGRVPSYYETFP